MWYQIGKKMTIYRPKKDQTPIIFIMTDTCKNRFLNLYLYIKRVLVYKGGSYKYPYLNDSIPYIYRLTSSITVR